MSLPKVDACEVFYSNVAAKASYLHLFENVLCDELLSRDTDQDGIADWSNSLDGKEITSLIPLDPDIDGDGAINELDLNPYEAGNQLGQMIPEPLLLQNMVDAQRALYEEYKVLLLDYSDVHSQMVVKAISTLFSKLPKKVLRHIRIPLVVYAFRKHGLDHEQAAYYSNLNAISMGGVDAGFMGGSNESEVLRALAHELGHVIVFHSINPGEMWKVSREFGFWDRADRLSDVSNLNDGQESMDKIDVATHFDPRLTRNVSGEGVQRNVHEWFAENIGNYLLKKAALNRSESTAANQSEDSMRFNAWLDRLFELELH